MIELPTKTFRSNLIAKNIAPGEGVTICEVGDAKQTHCFYPQGKLKRRVFGEDVNFSLRFTGYKETHDVKENQGKIVHRFESGEVWFYDKKGEAFEVELVFHRRPETNHFPFSYRSRGVVDWYFQPRLSCQEYEMGFFRPEDICNSYALYGEKRKLFHIKRPRIKDSNGSEVYGSLLLDKRSRTLTIIVDPSWLDTASYPIYIDPTIGYDTIGGTNASTGGSDRPYGNKISPGQSITLSKIYAYIKRQSGTDVNTKACIYDATGAGNEPGNITETSNTINTSDATFSWEEYTVGSSVGTDQWLLIVGNQGITTKYDSVSGTAGYSTSSISGFYSSPPDPFSPLSSFTDIGTTQYSVYADYTVNDSSFTPRSCFF